MKKIIFIVLLFFSAIIFCFSQINTKQILSTDEKIDFLYQDRLKKSILTLQEIVQILSCIPYLTILIGGIWSYRKFLYQRYKFPKAEINFNFSSIKFQKDKILIHVSIKIINKGNVLIKLDNYIFRINQFNPVKNNKNLKPFIDNEDMNWKLLDEYRYDKKDKNHLYEIEPSENHEFYFDIILKNDIKYLKFYFYLSNISKKNKKNIGWDKEIIYEIQ